MTTKFDVIVVGGGIVCCAIGTTWHAAGLVAELRASPNLTRLAKYSSKLYAELADHGEPTGFKRVGALTLAKSADRQFELHKQAAMARSLGVDCTWQSAAAIRERWPHILTEDLCGGVYMPNDGQTNPVDTTLALARLARRRGAEIREHSAVERILTRRGRVLGVLCDEEEIFADQVVVSAGLWSRQLGSTAGAHFPLQAAEHFYAVTEAVPQHPDQPIVRVPDDGIYVKPDAGRLLIGCFERQAKPIGLAQLPEGDFIELPFDLDHFMPYLEAGLARIDDVQGVGIRTWFNGPESFTPDGRYMLGESPCQWLNPDAGIEADVTITRIDAWSYWVVSAAASRVRDLHWMHRHLHPFQATITDITLDYAVIGIMGPNARMHLQRLTDVSLAANDFEFGTSQLINIAGVELRAMRITYVGALGWELYIPWIGRDFLHQQKAQGVNKQLTLLKLQNSDALLTHDEPVWQDGRIVGSIRSAAYSFTYDCTLATAYISANSPLTRKAIEAGIYQVEIADRMFDATASLSGWYDPQNLEIRC